MDAFKAAGNKEVGVGGFTCPCCGPRGTKAEHRRAARSRLKSEFGSVLAEHYPTVEELDAENAFEAEQRALDAQSNEILSGSYEEWADYESLFNDDFGKDDAAEKAYYAELDRQLEEEEYRELQAERFDDFPFWAEGEGIDW